MRQPIGGIAPPAIAHVDLRQHHVDIRGVDRVIGREHCLQHSPQTCRRRRDIAAVDPRVARIVDLKAPGSGESSKNLWANLDHLTPHDELKLVLADRTDYEWARQALAEHRLAERCPVLVSPVDSTLDATTLAEWVLTDRLPVRFQVQLHKRLWGHQRGK